MNGTEKEITDYTIENGNELGKDVTEIEIKFGKFSAFVPVTVSENILVSIEVTTQPTKTEYIEGQTFDKTGMVVTGTLLDGSSVLISGYSVSENKLSTDDTKIEVVFKEKITYVNIVVKKNIVTKIEVTKQPIKTEYVEGQKFDKTVGELISEQRVIVFRDDEFAIDCKSHFPDIVESCEFSSNAFITAITDAIKSQLAKQHNVTISDAQLKEIQQEQIKERDEIVEEMIQEEIKAETAEELSSKRQEMLETIKKNQRLIEKSKLDEIREILKTVGKPLTELDDETLATVYDLAKL